MSESETEPKPPVHELKCWPIAYVPMDAGEKTAEFRKDDRVFCVGDLLRLREWDEGAGEYTGRECYVKVTHIVRGPRFGIPEGYCMMSISGLYR